MSPMISFEIFPPKTDDGLEALTDTIGRLMAADPSYVSVTYGAGGSQQQRSFDAARAVLGAGTEHVAAHLTCVGQSRADVDEAIDTFCAIGVDRFVALRGDPPGGVGAPYHPHPDGYHHTADLVAGIRRRTTANVAVSAYPERHPHSPSIDHDLDVLSAKIDAGADHAITQMFFDNDCFLRYLDAVRGRGLGIPVVPGIFPIHSFEAVSRFAAGCGASMPERIGERFAGLADDADTARKIAAELAAEQILELVAHGVNDVHLYTLNRADLALAVCEQLGVLDPAPSGEPTR